ncbi:MAG: hypothetical protein KatS3mg005_0686 [Bryobacteraceae bacterium]|nr:MAG: hypothetical protein KatS3mg005_0686 [Bryobacteraceae bacterium]
MKRIIFCASVWAALGATAALAQTLNPLPAKVFGQPGKPRSLNELNAPAALAPNLAKPASLFGPNSVAVDTSLSPPALYIADTGNHRVLAWRDASLAGTGRPADLVLGQRSFHSSAAVNITAAGAFTSSLYAPTSVAVDAQGNVFVMDAGNNRILRFPKPFEQPESESIRADLVIGQPNLRTNLPNRSSTATAPPAASTIKTNGANTGGIQNASIAFDSEGNLWLSDSGNHRILRYPAAAVSGPSNTGASPRDIAADLVLGQPDFVTATPNAGRADPARGDRLLRSSIRFGGPLAFDSQGNLFFADDLARVLVWQPPFSNGQPASRLLGIYIARAGSEPLAAVNPFTFGFRLGQSGSTVIFAGGPQGLWCEGDYLFVADTYNNRVVRYDPVASWPPEDPLQGQISPRMSAVFGQEDFSQNTPNRWQFAEPTAESLRSPVAGAFAAGRMFIVDQGNHRVLGLPYDADNHLPLPADALYGQMEFGLRSPNMPEGRELSGGSLQVIAGNQIVPLGVGPAMAFHYPSNPDEPPHLYIADTGNNRILAYWDARQFDFGKTADLVIGQVGLTRSLANSPHNNPAVPTRTGLLLPSSVAVDPDGNLWVADTGNGRLLRFPRPFDSWATHPEADVVLGQPDFETTPDGEPRRDRLFRPISVAVTGDGKVIAADPAHHRVLVFQGPFENGQPAAVVLGQPDGESATPGADLTRMNFPLSVAVDASERIYVADSNNNRLLVFERAELLADGIGPGLALNLAAGNRNVTPVDVKVNRSNGDIWIADGRQNRVLRYPKYEELLFAAAPQWNYGFSTYGPRTLALDNTGGLYVADAAHRITMHYPLHGVINGASGFPRVAPATIVLLQTDGARFTDAPAEAGGVPLPKELSDVEVLVEGLPAPLLSVGETSIRLIVPKDAPISGLAEFLVRRPSTGEILAHAYITMSNASPAVLFSGTNPATQGQARAVNQNGTPNSSSSPVSVGQELTVYLTGTGPVDGLPPDGEAPGAEVPVGDVQAYVITSSALIQATVLSATLDPEEPGVWRVRIRVPQVAADGNYGFAVIYRSTASNRMPDGSRTSLPTIAIRR